MSNLSLNSNNTNVESKVSVSNSRFFPSRSRSRSRSRHSRSRAESKHHLDHVAEQLLNFYEDDEVCRLSPEGKIQFGLVGHSYECKGSSSAVLPNLPTQLKIFWTLGSKVEVQDLFVIVNSKEPQCHVRLIDRKVKEGDLIKVGSREGEVIDVNFVACLKCMENNEAIVDIPCENLEPVLSYSVGQKIVVHGWLGIITSVEVQAALMFSNGKTCNVNLNKICNSKRPYPGCQVVYRMEEYLAAGAEFLDTGEKFTDMFKEDSLPAFVVFVQVESVEINWIFQLPLDDEERKIPSSTLRRSSLKKYAKLIEPSIKILWGSDDTDFYEGFYRYAIHPNDLVLGECSKNLERLLIQQLFPERKVDEVEKSKGIDNVSYVVRVLRSARIATVRWKDTDTVETIRSSSITSRHSFPERWHQIVQKKEILAPAESDKFGVTLSRHTNDMVSVQWFLLNKGEETIKLIKLEVLEESKYDLEPHFLYGEILPSEIVCRDSSCKILPALFSYGVVHDISPSGFVIVEDTVTKRECEVLPCEIKLVGISAKRKDKGERLRHKSVDATGMETPEEEIKIWQNSIFKTESNLTNNDVETLPPDEKFKILKKAPNSHNFYEKSFVYKQEYLKVVNLDREVLSQVFNEGLWVRGYKDRMDLYSAMIVGSDGTPYRDGLFHFDLYLPPTYSRKPPEVYFVTELSTQGDVRLQPGPVDFKLLGAPNPQTVLETLLLIQRRFFLEVSVPTPVAKSDGNPIADSFDAIHKIEKSRIENSATIIAVVDSLLKLLNEPPELWRTEIIRYGLTTFPKMSRRLLMLLKKGANNSGLELNFGERHKPLSYHLLPLSRGFIQAVQNRIEKMQNLSEAGEGIGI